MLIAYKRPGTISYNQVVGRDYTPPTSLLLLRILNQLDLVALRRIDKGKFRTGGLAFRRSIAKCVPINAQVLLEGLHGSKPITTLHDNRIPKAAIPASNQKKRPP